MAGLKWVNKYKKQKCKVFSLEEMAEYAEENGLAFDLEKTKVEREAKIAEKLKKKEEEKAK
jgi:hypothetical protein